MEYGLIGEKLGHSFSKEIHTLLADYDYTLCEIPKGDLDDFLTKRAFRAVNVTIPYKQAVIPYLAQISPEAKEIGAVNTVVNREGKLYGYNTDFYGICAALAKMGVTSLAGKKALILGTGGTSLTARAALRSLGAASILRVSRTPREEDTVSYEEALAHHTDAAVIFNTTPVGMYPNADASPISLDAFPALSCVFDAVYNPLRTRLVQDALARGIPASGGLYMLVAQAFRAAEIFLDKSLSSAALSNTYKRILRSKENVVLIGMPASGKTTAGRALARELNRELIDLDAALVADAGRDIPTIFREDGEARFRDLEAETVAKYAAKTGLIIATGGGVVLRSENVARLKQNGRLFFLDRDLDSLYPTADRPTASTREAIEARYRERLPLYLAAADVTVKPNGYLPDTIAQIKKELFS
ncbi:MAG: shikimate dehydrogenase [Clostridia bacterium]|nr:shikimate dehydrogenase [Clostridia bacterium]